MSILTNLDRAVCANCETLLNTKADGKFMLKLNSWLVLFAVIVVSAGCASVALDVPKSYSEAIATTTDTEYGGYAAEWKELHGEQSGFYPLADGMDALGARLEMAEKAQNSIDLQYFLMSDDESGLVISDALLRAADRGVRIRFLLDDIFTTAPDSRLQLLNQHPNIEVRLFNPVSRRGSYYLNFASHFRQANRRMHNKSFTVDNAVSIVGGRNLADEYFDLNKTSTFSDFDMLAMGSIVNDISSGFDQFWNSILAIPIEELSDNVVMTEEEFAVAEKAFEAKNAGDYDDLYQRALASPLLQNIQSGEAPLYVADARLLMDDPDKLVNRVSPLYDRLITELGVVLGNAKEEILFINPYYVPEDSGVEFARTLVNSGIRVAVLTNSLAANNHVAVFSAYSKYRKPVLDAGVELYEIRANAGKEVSEPGSPDKLTLHTKLILIDRRYLFVGSLNLDPRSFQINSEMGVLIDSAELVSVMTDGIWQQIPDVAYRVTQNEAGKLEWRGQIDGVNVVETKEPLTGGWLRFKAWFSKIAPQSQM